MISSRWCLVFDSWQFIFQLFSAINGPKKSTNSALLLSIIWLLFCKCLLLLSFSFFMYVVVQNWLWLVHNYYVSMLIYNIFYMSHIISSKPNEHKTFDIISISFTHILFKASTMELYILMIYCNASYAHWIIRANLCCKI